MSTIGKIERDLTKPDASDLGDFSKTVRFARIVDVFDASTNIVMGRKSQYGKVSVVFLDSLSTPPITIPFLTTWYTWTRGAGILFMPEQNDIVACLDQLNGYPTIIGFLPYKWDESVKKPTPYTNAPIGYTKPLYKGEILVKSSSGGSILLDKKGTITIDGSDYSLAEKVVSNIDNYNNETSYSRVFPIEESGISHSVIGNRYYLDGSVKNIGNFPQIFESGSSIPVKGSLSLPFSKSIRFTLPNDVEIIKIEAVSVVGSNTADNKSSVKPLSEGQYRLEFTNIYARCSDNPSDANYKPALTDKNLIGYTLHIDTTSVSGNSVKLEYIAQKFLGGIRVNTAGDVFIDGRNVVIRSENERSHIELNKLGKASIAGVSTTTVGTPGLGYLECSQNNVRYSAGIAGSEKDETNPIVPARLSETLGTIQLYYVSDMLPLMKCTKNGDAYEFSPVTKQDYTGYSVDIKANVQKLWFSPSDKLFNEQKLENMMNQDVLSYGELKRLG